MLIYDGKHSQPERVTLRAGQLQMEFEDGKLLYVRAGEHEIVRRVYVGVRDENWGTVPARVRDVTLDVQSDSFRVAFQCDHAYGDVRFTWRGEITGGSESTVRFTFDGQALTAFKRNRIGFCVLHPASAAGQAVEVEHVDGTREAGQFPVYIQPDVPFFDVRTLTTEIEPRVRAVVRMDGDTFETEDQRNWLDASYKTYSTPSKLPIPVLLEAGTRLQQSVTINLIGTPTPAQVNEMAILRIDAEQKTRIPYIGLGMASDDVPLTEVEFERLAALNPSHLRCDLRFTPDMEERLFEAVEDVDALDCDLELAVHLGADAQAELERLRDALSELDHGDIYALIFREGEPTTSAETLALAEQVLEDADGVYLVAGSDGFFADFNTQRPPKTARVVYTINPQVHATDNATIIEAIATVAAQVETARQFVGDAEIYISPVSLRSVHNPDVQSFRDNGGSRLPQLVDQRQPTLFAAGWTVGVIASAARASANSLTFYETTGWLGVMERAEGTPLPNEFSSIPGGVYPLYHVFADVGEVPNGHALLAESSHPLKFSGLALHDARGLRLLIVNHTAERLTVTVTGLSGAFTLKQLDEMNAEFAMRDPRGFRSAPGEQVSAGADGLTVDLLPFALARLDSA